MMSHRKLEKNDVVILGCMLLGCTYQEEENVDNEVKQN